VRFGGCNLHCDYCDEPDTIPISSGKDWDLGKIQRKITSLAKGKRHRSISWTGGEPLLHSDILEKLMPWANEQGFENFLETNGALPERLKRVAGFCDVIAMDVKLPSATGRDLWQQHEEFLRVAPEKTFVKVILTAASTEDEWHTMVELLSSAGLRVPLILQPATPMISSEGTANTILSIPPERAVDFLNQARAHIKIAKLIPQWHPVWKLP
jgi:organic radical activating enzyme